MQHEVVQLDISVKNPKLVHMIYEFGCLNQIGDFSLNFEPYNSFPKVKHITSINEWKYDVVEIFFALITIAI